MIGTGHLPPISITNRLGYAYLSLTKRIAIDPDTNNITVEELIDGIWQPASFGTGPNSIWIGRNVGVAAAGHHLLTEDAHGMFHYHTHSDFDGELSLSDVQTLYSHSFLTRYESQSDDTNEWIGTEFAWSAISTINGLMKKGYWKTGSITTSKPIRIQTWHGDDENGTLEFDQTYPASHFTANEEIETLENGFIELVGGENYFTKISSEANFSLLTNAAETMPWNAIDIALTRYDNLLQTTEWIDGATYIKNDSWFIKNRKIYICNVTGAQNGTFEDNADKWDILGSNHIAYNSAADFASLPPASEHTLEIWIVLNSTGIIWNKRRGLYHSDGASWSRMSNVTYQVTDAEAFFRDDVDNSKIGKFELSEISAETTRTFSFPDVSGRIFVDGMTADVSLNGLLSVNQLSKNGITVPNQNEIYNYATGWLEGGAITINSGNNTLIDIAAGSVSITDYTDQMNPDITKITWSAQTGLDPGLAGRSTWIGVQDNGSGVAEFVYDVSFDSTQRRSIAILGRIWDNAGTGPQITSVGEYERPAWQLTTAFQDFILEYGSWNISGNKYSANGANLLLDKSAGTSFRYNAENTPGIENVHVDAAQTPRTAYAYHLQGSSVVTAETDIDPDNYDVSGVKTAVPNNKWTIQEIWFFPVSGTCHVLYGQDYYSSKGDALNGLSTESKVRNTEILDGAIKRGYIIIQQGCADLSDLDEAELREVNGAIGGGSPYWQRDDGVLSPAEAGDSIKLTGAGITFDPNGDTSFDLITVLDDVNALFRYLSIVDMWSTNKNINISSGAYGAGNRFFNLADGMNDIDIYTKDTTPEGSITADKGSVCLTGSGELYTKTTDSVNTGWKALLHTETDPVFSAWDKSIGSLSGTTQYRVPFGNASGGLIDSPNLTYSDSALRVSNGGIYIDRSGADSFIAFKRSDSQVGQIRGAAGSIDITESGGSPVHLSVDTTSGITTMTRVNTSKIGNSGGILKLNPDATGIVELFGDADVDNSENGRMLYVWRRAPEGDDYLRFYISDNRVGVVSAPLDLTVYGGESVTLQSAGKDVIFRVGDDAGVFGTYFKNSSNAIVGSVDSLGNAQFNTSIDVPEISNTLGLLKIQPDVQGDVELFGDTDVDNADNSKIFKIWRRAPEGNDYIRFYISDNRKAYIHASNDLTLQAQVPFTINSVTDSIYFKVGDSAGVKKFYFQDSDNADLVTIDSNGFVGIGTSNPSTLLELSNTEGGASLKLTGSGAAVTQSIQHEYDINYSRTVGHAIIDFRALSLDGESPGQYRFGLQSGSTGENSISLFEPNSALTQTSIASSGMHTYFNAQGGNFGIGVTAPASKLDVNGVLRISGGNVDYLLQGVTNDFRIGPVDKDDSLYYNKTATLWSFLEGELQVGSGGIQQGILYLVGAPETDGGETRFYLADDHDTNIAYFALKAYEDDLYLGPDTDPDAFQFIGNDTAVTARFNVDVAIMADFAVYTDTLFVDGVSELVGINNDSPSYPLDVKWNMDEVLLNLQSVQAFDAGVGPALRFAGMVSDTIQAQGGLIKAAKYDAVSGNRGFDMIIYSGNNAGAPVEMLRLSAEAGDMIVTGNVGIGTTSPNITALLDIVSTTKGILLPRMTSAQRDDISSPATALLLYDTTNGKYDYYDGSLWKSFVSTNASSFIIGSIPFATDTHHLNDDNANLFWDNTNKRLGIGTSDPKEELHIASLHPTMTFEETDADSNEKVWEFGASAEEFFLRTANDLHTGTQTVWKATERASTGIGVFSIPNAKVGIGTDDPSGKLTVDQPSVSGGIPVLTLDQADVSEPWIEFLGGTISTGKNGQNEYLEVLINGSTRYLRLFN